MIKKDYDINSYISKYGLSNNLNIYRITRRNNAFLTLHNKEDESIWVRVDLKNCDFVVGDYVLVEKVKGEYYITSLLERESLITKAQSTSKKSFAYNDKEQLVAANVDQIFILISADQRFSLGKFERYVSTFYHMAKDMHIIISKSDYNEEASIIENEILKIYPNIEVAQLSIYNPISIQKVINLFEKGKTSILIGSSGVGKSTLINTVLNKKELSTQKVRSDGKGKHTTTSSSMYFLSKTSSYIIDTPGFKTIASHRQTDDTLLFQSIYDLSLKCKFNDCSHVNEPGCAIQLAIEKGDLSKELYDRYLKYKDKERRYEEYIIRKNKKGKTNKRMKVITKSGILNNNH
ncbi:ribosome small subunit-dependent GTPase A [Facklamia sp. 7083-14-GEN3]|uniref:ribosome small subunit-dependent GTPase A n=1 Tax=Facklamia sp. 7083-14-GEN3 TaxID=2973478 RepID=UPI00215BD764|nr:ribosome small subunit-dependent GTPase A [Facklamia sp. 7083-14-GEN3]MCR8969532.1 ribosome small subunit-dependent GTPase A [Facklamia sp. 7083-14-GEN3]